MPDREVCQVIENSRQSERYKVQAGKEKGHSLKTKLTLIIRVGKWDEHKMDEWKEKKKKKADRKRKTAAVSWAVTRRLKVHSSRNPSKSGGNKECRMRYSKILRTELSDSSESNKNFIP